MIELVKQASAANVLTGEALSFLWVMEFCQTKHRLPKIEEVKAGVEADYGQRLTTPTAARGRAKARNQIIKASLSASSQFLQ